MADTTRTKVVPGTTGIGFKYLLDEDISSIGTNNLIPNETNNLAGKIIFTKNGIVVDGYLIAEPNGALESSFAQAIKDLNISTVFKGAVVIGYINGTSVANPTALYKTSGDWTESNKISPEINKLYYNPTNNALFYWVADLSCYTSVSHVYETLNGKIKPLESHATDTSNPHGVTKAQIGLGKVDNTADEEKVVKSAGQATCDSAGNTIVDTYATKATVTSLTSDYTSLKNDPTKYGIATLDTEGKVPSSQLPSYVDDVLEYSSKSEFPAKGEAGKIYVDTTTNLTYRWGGSSYVEISASLALGETSSTAYAGNKGKAVRTDLDAHIANTSNPHGVTKAQVGLGNVDNTSDADKVVKGASQDGSGNVIANTYLRKDAVQTSSLDGKSSSEVPSVSLVYNETAKIWTGTQAEYDALSSYDPRTAYFITDPDIVYSDLNFGRFIAFSDKTTTSTEFYEFYKALYIDGYCNKKEVYMKCYYGSSDAGSDGYHLIQYQGAAKYNSETYQVFSCLYSERSWIRVGFKMGGTTQATVHVFSDGMLVTNSDLASSVSSSSSSKEVASAKAVYDAVHAVDTKVTTNTTNIVTNTSDIAAIKTTLTWE